MTFEEAMEARRKGKRVIFSDTGYYVESDEPKDAKKIPRDYCLGCGAKVISPRLCPVCQAKADEIAEVREIPVEDVKPGMEVWHTAGAPPLLTPGWKRVTNVRWESTHVWLSYNDCARGEGVLRGTKVRVRNAPAPTPTVEERLSEVERRVAAVEKTATMSRDAFVDHVADRIFHDVPLVHADVPDREFWTIGRYAASVGDKRLPDKMRDAIRSVAQEIVEWVERQQSGEADA